MSAFPYGSFAPDLDTILAADITTGMGLHEGVLMDPNPAWQLKGSITMGIRMHGDAVPSSFHTTMTQSNNFAPGIAAAAAAWGYINTWVSIVPATENTTTNARVAISEAQLYLLKSSTGIWTRVGNGSEQPASLQYYDKTTFIYQGSSSDRKLHNGIGTFNNCYTVASRTAAKTDNAEFHILHNSLLSRTNLYQDGSTIDPADVGGVFVTCKTTLVPEVAGDAFNGTTGILISIGSDIWYDDTSGIGDVGTYLQYVGYNPGCGISRYEYVPDDGTTRRHYFCTVKPDANTFVDPSSAYAVANGSAALYTPVATITENPPVLIVNTPIP